ncbi:hypothetical protein [Actinoplanes awajinensis]|uniref:Uncharacterized protein n=1 Tax=Actinoplanes awajinensis subsp. mycoplanecinus TaxID=135947 RepID=A0A101JNN9_9ACTN|nr:hypothetical protein [Actinoplanes awajinensis]KUL29853.1 hypothetical protein ADL15_26275 [Actinoplanes awajinensis subsp. mycoplanecinus]
MRQVYAHHAILQRAHGADPGAVVTSALGGATPHRTTVSPDGDRLRVLFAAAPDLVDEIRGVIDTALAAGPWELVEAGCARLDPGERPQARLLLREIVTPAG